MVLFGLGPLANVNFWSSLLDTDSAQVQKTIGNIDVGLYNILFVMPKLQELLARGTDQEGMVVTSNDGAKLPVKRLRMMISENSVGLTQTVVMTNVFKAVEEFYEVLFPLHKTSYVPLSIGAMDSGSAKVIDFFGVDEVMKDMTEVLAAVWHRVKYSMVDNFRYEIQVSVSCVEFYSRLEEAKRAKLVTQEDVQRIVHTIAKSIEVIFRNGAYTEDMNKVDDMRASAVLQRRMDAMEQRKERAVETPPEAPAENVEIFQKPPRKRGNGNGAMKPRAH